MNIQEIVKSVEDMIPDIEIKWNDNHGGPYRMEITRQLAATLANAGVYRKKLQDILQLLCDSINTLSQENESLKEEVQKLKQEVQTLKEKGK